MEKIIFVLALLSFSFTVAMGAGKTSSKKQVLHPPVLINYLSFKDGPNGKKIAFTSSNPNIMNEFEHPVLCPPYNDPVYGNENMPFCGAPMVFMNKGGEVVFWEEMLGERGLYEYEVEGGSITDQAIGHNPDYWVVETPKSMYYCLYKNHTETTCRLFPDDDEDIKIGDRMASCISNPVSWLTDKDGLFYDCYPKGDFRKAEFVVESISDEGIMLRCTKQYNSQPLNQNGRIESFGIISDSFSLIKLKNIPKAKSNPKTKKK